MFQLTIDSHLVIFLTMVSSFISTTCIIFCLYSALINKSNIAALGITLDLRMSQLLKAAELKANAEGQMQGRDWALQQNTIAAAEVISNVAEKAAAQLILTAANTASKLPTE